MPDDPGARAWTDAWVRVSLGQVGLGGLFQVVTGDGSDGVEVGHQVRQGDLGHRPDLFYRLPGTTTCWVHVKAGRPAVGLPHRGTPPQPAHPAVLDACHVPDQPGNMIGVWGGLPAYFRRGQALTGPSERLQVFLESALDSR